jgi:hypothetical protein
MILVFEDSHGVYIGGDSSSEKAPKFLIEQVKRHRRPCNALFNSLFFCRLACSAKYSERLYGTEIRKRVLINTRFKPIQHHMVSLYLSRCLNPLAAGARPGSSCLLIISSLFPINFSLKPCRHFGRSRRSISSKLI